MAIMPQFGSGLGQRIGIHQHPDEDRPECPVLLAAIW
jgi:hypothetical protein